MDHKLHHGRAAFILFVLIITLTAFFSMGTAASLDEPSPYFKVTSEDGSKFYFVDKDGNPVDDTASYAQTPIVPRTKAGTLPSEYDARDYGLVTPVKNQNPTGSCWAFSAISAIESNVIKKGLGTLGNVDYSEAHLVWFATNPYVSNTSDPTYGDGTNLGTGGFNSGGNYLDASSALLRGSGVTNDSDYPFSGYSLSSMQYPESDRYQSVMRLKGCYRLDTNDSNFNCSYSNDDIKQAILDYGSVQGCYQDNNSYYNVTSTYSAYYNNYDNCDINHAVTIVGWDDSFPKTNFKYGNQPANDGAWLIKNSWGTGYYSNGPVNGYMYISYEDVSLGWFAAYEAEAKNTFDNLYTYNGTSYGLYFGGGTSQPVANVFQTDSKEDLTQVGFFTVVPGCTYKINVFTDLASNYTNPTQGTQISNVASGTCTYSGYHTVDLANVISLDANEIYAVELVLSKSGASNLIAFEGTDGHCNAKQTYFYLSYLGGWKDCSLSVASYSLNNAYITAMTKEAHTHVWANPVVTAPTCTGQGYTTYTCSCGETNVTDYVSALGHAFGPYTCTNGVHTRTCTRITCSEIQTAACTYGTPVITKAATCTETGTKIKTCTVCNTTAAETIPALGHLLSGYTHNADGTHTVICTRTGCSYSATNTCSYSAWTQTKAPTCTIAGSEARTCSVCKFTETRAIAKLGHDLGGWVYNSGVHTRQCRRTGCSYSETQSCTCGEWITDAAPTCTVKGSRHAVCSVCGGTKTEDIASLGHSMYSWVYNNGTHTRTCQREGCGFSETGNCTYTDWTQTLAPTCTEAGLKTRTCTVCGGVDTLSVNALGHSYSAWVYNHGTHSRSCTRAGCTDSLSASCTYGGWAVTLTPTCTVNGSEKNTCTVCGGYETREIAATGHNMGAWVYSNGTHTRSCSNTGCTYKVTENCSFGEWTQTKAPTCTAKGSRERICSVCGGKQTEEIPQLGHAFTGWEYNNGTHARSCTRTGCTYTESAACSYGSWVTISSPTCTEAGRQEKTCSVCGGTAVQYPPKLGHSMSSWVYDNGTHTKSCTRTGCTYKETESCAYGNWVVITEPTCTAAGSRRRVCTICGGAENQQPAALGHSMGIWACTAGNHSRNCTRSGCTYKESGACTYGSWTVTKEADCTQAGSRYKTCTVCATRVTESLNALGHDYGAFVSDNNGKHTRACLRDSCGASETVPCSYSINSTTATCTTPGSTVYVCEVCGYTYNVAGETVPHNFGSWVYSNGKHTRSCQNQGCTYTETADCTYTAWSTVPATCTADGSQTRACTVCGRTETIVLNALGHDMSSWVYNNGTHVKTCKRAGCTYTETAGCTYTAWSIVPAACTANGSQTRTCTVCGGTETIVLNALGHDMGAWADNKDGTHTRSCKRTGCTCTENAACSYGSWTVTVEAACLTAGSRYRVCSVCGSTETEAIPAAGHTAGDWVTAKEATCTAEGTREKRCSVCNLLLATETVSAKGHTPGEWHQLTSPTCTADGSEELRCTVCSCVIDTRTVPHSGHTAGEWSTTKAATCTEDGTKEQSCKVCGALLASESIPAKGHTPGELTVEVEATCHAEGISRIRCKDCSAVISSRVIPVNTSAHSFGAWSTTREATCTAEGESTRTCALCGRTETKPIPAAAHTDADDDGYCDVCSAELTSHEPEEPTPSFLERIKQFFQKIADFFKRLFGG